VTRQSRLEVLRHGLQFRILHWSIFIEGVLLTLTGFQLGGYAGIVVLTTGNLTVHVVTGVAYTATALLFFGQIVYSKEYSWVALRRIPYSLRFIVSETKAWLGVARKPRNPILYDEDRGRYVEKLVPSVIIVFWAFLLMGALLGLTGLALAFPAQFFFVYTVVNPVGDALTGVTGIAFMLVLHRLITFFLIALVAAHVYASFVFKLVTSMITGNNKERVAGYSNNSRHRIKTRLTGYD
jgi:F420-nonreducing hydrogenase I cytochrome b subunit